VSGAFGYRDGELWAEDVPLTAIADAVGTPAYVYAAAPMRARVEAFFEAFAGQRVLLCYALKANGNLAVVRTLADAGLSGSETSVLGSEGSPKLNSNVTGVSSSVSTVTSSAAGG
jgi:diaminopimelate decarboxylase